METCLIGYGTLLHRGSLGDSIGSSRAHAKDVVPVVVEGYKRLFNLRPTHYESSAKLDLGPIENAAMNVEEAPGFRFNGLAFPVSREELEILDRRERYYQRKSASILAFPSAEPIGQGHLYSSLPDANWIERDIDALMPLWRDIELARGGAYAISCDFGRLYDDTTYLADGVTLVADYYRDLLVDQPVRKDPSR